MNVTCAVCGSDRVKRVRKKFAVRYNQVPVVIKNERYIGARHAAKNSSLRNSHELSRRIKDRVREDLGGMLGTVKTRTL
jgi:hypothetical protein